MPAHPVSVYIVDDSPRLTEYLCELLRGDDAVEIAGSADSAMVAIEDISRSVPDVVIVDLQLKDGNGFDVVKAIRALPRSGDIVVILFTNHSSPALHKHAASLGANFSLDKYRDHAKVLEIIHGIVRTRQE